eukprot:6049240-Amphidinium_carterae.2
MALAKSLLVWSDLDRNGTVTRLDWVPHCGSVPTRLFRSSSVLLDMGCEKLSPSSTTHHNLVPTPR